MNNIPNGYYVPAPVYGNYSQSCLNDRTGLGEKVQNLESVYIDIHSRIIILLKDVRKRFHSENINDVVKSNGSINEKLSASDKNSQKITTYEICKGYFTVKEAFVYKCVGKELKEAEIKIEFVKYNDQRNEVVLPENSLRDDNTLKKIFQSNDMFYQPKNFHYLKQELFNQIQRSTRREIQLGFNYDSERKSVTHGRENEIMHYAYETEEVKSRCGFNDDILSAENLLKQLYFSIGCAASCYTLMYDKICNDLPIIVFVSSDFNNMKDKAEEIFCTDGSSSVELEKGFECNFDDIVDNVILLTLSKTTSYKRKILLSDLNRVCSRKTERKGLIVLLTDSADNLNDETIDTDNFIVLPFKDIYTADKGAVYWFQKLLIKVPERVEDLYTAYTEVLSHLNEQRTLSQSKQKLFAFITAVLRVSMTAAKSQFNNDWFNKFIKTICDDCDCADSYLVELFKDYLINADNDLFVRYEEAGITDDRISCDDESLYITRENMMGIAQSIGVSSNSLVKELGRNSILEMQGKSYQYNIYIDKKKTQHVYKIRLNRLYPAGCVRVETYDYYIKKPSVKISLGRNSMSGKEIFFTLDDAPGNENANCFVLGKSGAGKSNFLAHIAKQAALAECEVMIIGSDITYNDYMNKIGYKNILDTMRYKDKDETIIDWKELCFEGCITLINADENGGLDSVLESFYRYKASVNKVRYCFLILDECQEFDMSEKSVIINKILRKGRKLGMITIFSSQYINSNVVKGYEDIVNQCSSFFEFSTSNATRTMKNLNVSSSDEDYIQLREMVTSLEVGSCVARGKIATQLCKLNYPILIEVPEKR